MSRSPHTFLSKHRRMAGMAIGAIAMLAMAGPAAAQTPVFQVTAVIQVPVSGQGANTFFSFDISWNDPVLNKFFLADRNNKAIDVVDAATLQITQFVNPGYAGFTGNNDTSGPDGVLTANNHTELWVGDSPGKVWVLNATTGAVKTLPGGASNPISVGGTTRADELCYSPADNLIMIASPGEDPPFVTFISTTTYRIVSKLPFDGSAASGGLKATNGLEQCGYSPVTGRFYQNVPEVNGAGNDTSPGAVAVINPSTLPLRVETSFPVPLPLCAGPQGMAIGPNNQILLGCNAGSPGRNTVMIDATNGGVLAAFQDLGGLDAVTFNPGNGLYFLPSCNTECRTVGNGIFGTEVLGVVDSSTLPPSVVQLITVASQNSATTVTTGNPRTTHSVAADANSNNVFLPIPAVGGNVPQFAPTLCDSSGPGITVIGAPSTTIGCIAILGTAGTTFVPPGQPEQQAQQAQGMQ